MNENENPIPEAPQIWQTQKREQLALSLEDVRAKASKAQSRVRRNLIASIVIGTVLLILCLMAFVAIRMTAVRVITFAMMLVVTFVAFNTSRRLASTRTLPRRAALDSCLAFYKKVLLAQYRSLSVRWRLIIPSVVFLWLTWKLIDERSSHVMMRTVLPASLVITFFIRRYEVAKLRRELASVNAFEQGH